MIYQKRGKWFVPKSGRLEKYNTKEEAMKAAGIMDKGPDPLESLRSNAPVYKTFEAAVEDHGEDEGDFVEED
jgi:hypothetical protein